MKKLWAPWRMQFIEDACCAKKECVFCDVQKNKKTPKENLVLYRGKGAFIIMNKYPYNNGHLMVIPKRHVASMDKLTPRDRAEMMELVNKSITALTKLMNPNGFNVGMNLGRAAGAGIDAHMHIHIVPRWNGDTNFMPVIAETKTLPEHIDVTYDKILAVITGKKGRK